MVFTYREPLPGVVPNLVFRYFFALFRDSGLLGSLGWSWGDFWALLGRPWAAFGTSWALLGGSSVTFCDVFGSLGWSWGAFLRPWVAFGTSWALLGRFWVTFGW